MKNSLVFNSGDELLRNIYLKDLLEQQKEILEKIRKDKPDIKVLKEKCCELDKNINEISSLRLETVDYINDFYYQNNIIDQSQKSLDLRFIQNKMLKILDESLSNHETIVLEELISIENDMVKIIDALH